MFSVFTAPARMKTYFLRLVTLLFLMTLYSCRTLNPSAEKVVVYEQGGVNCKNLGVVNVDWSWWGTSSETLNALRNMVAAKGGNTLVQTQPDIGIAYFCADAEHR